MQEVKDDLRNMIARKTYFLESADLMTVLALHGLRCDPDVLNAMNNRYQWALHEFERHESKVTGYELEMTRENAIEHIIANSALVHKSELYAQMQARKVGRFTIIDLDDARTASGVVEAKVRNLQSFKAGIDASEPYTVLITNPKGIGGIETYEVEVSCLPEVVQLIDEEINAELSLLELLKEVERRITE